MASTRSSLRRYKMGSFLQTAANDALIESRVRNGQCHLCGCTLYTKTTTSTSAIPIFLPLSNDQVLSGRCLSCHPKQESQEIETTNDAALQPVTSETIEIRDWDGRVYTGRVLEGSRSKGMGIFQHTDDGGVSTYEGDFENGHFQGKCTRMVESTGATYVGDVHLGAAHGVGTCSWPEGWTYHGEWHYDQRHGRGILRQDDVTDGEIYDGEWKDDVWNGKGVLLFAGGGHYQGEFRNGKLEGSGRYVFAEDQSVYEGEFKDGFRSGRGSMIYGNGEHYSGEWKNNCREGMGTLNLPGGKVFRGTFRADFRETGTLQLPNGQTFWETWEDGQLVRSTKD